MPDAVVPVVGNRWIYHFTHIDNLVSIRADAYVRCDATARQGMTNTEVGARDIKESRRRRAIPISPYGHVGDYVPFYFGPRSPMMYRIACDHRDSIPNRYGGGDIPLVYLVTTVGAVVTAGLTWIATDGNAATATTEFSSDLNETALMIDWPLMTADRWSNTARIPTGSGGVRPSSWSTASCRCRLFGGFGVQSDQLASQVGKLLVDHALDHRIIVRPHWYYGYGRR